MVDYVYIKLVTNDDILSYKVGETDTTVFLSKPIQVGQKLSTDGKLKAYAIPYCGLAKGNVIELQKTSCIFCCDMKDDARSYYDRLADQHYEDLDKPVKKKVINIDIEDSVEEAKEDLKVTKSVLH
jgi:hypothetical protein